MQQSDFLGIAPAKDSLFSWLVKQAKIAIRSLSEWLGLRKQGISRTFPLDANLPLNPVGYYLLLEERRAIQKTAGGIFLAPETQDAQQYLTQIGKVVAMGDLCYTHDAFKGQAWAGLGDNVLFYKNSGIRIDLKTDGDETTRYRLMKDNDLLAIVNDPDRVKGAVV